MEFLDYAIRYADNGFPVFPCVPNGKKPLIENGFKSATLDTEQIEEWWTDNPNANIGIATQGLVVVDVDGADNSWLKGEEELFIQLSMNAVCVTPRGGAHYWFRQAKDEPVRSSVSRIAPNVDIRADGGYVVVPPSHVIDDEKGINGSYQWVYPQSLDTLDELTIAPEWLLRQIHRISNEPVNKTFGTGNIIPSGQRNSALASIAGTVRRIGCSEGEIRCLLRAINSERCDPPIDNQEVDQIARSIARYEPDQVSTAVVEGWAMQDNLEEDNLPHDPGPIPPELMSVPGLIGQIIEHNLTTAFKPQPELALAASICLMSTLTGRKIEDDRGTRTNVYAFGIAGTGAGKEHARKLNKEILFNAGAEHLVGPEGFASHAGIVSVVEQYKVQLFQIDEFGRVLKTIKNASSSPHLAQIITVLLKMYTSANSQYVGDAYADTTKIKRIEQPHAVLYGTTVPDSFFEGLTFDSLNDGFLSRVLCFFSSNNLPEPISAERKEIPVEIIEQAREWINFQPGGNLSDEFAQPQQVVVTPEASEIFRCVEVTCRERQAEQADACSALWSRVEEKARTLAMIYAASRDGITPTVDGDAASWGATLAEHLTRELIYKAGGWITRGQHDANIKEMLRAIHATKDRGISRRDLNRKFQHLRRNDREDAIRFLTEDSQQVAIVDKPTGQPGRPPMVYIARRYQQDIG